MWLKTCHFTTVHQNINTFTNTGKNKTMSKTKVEFLKFVKKVKMELEFEYKSLNPEFDNKAF